MALWNEETGWADLSQLTPQQQSNYAYMPNSQNSVAATGPNFWEAGGASQNPFLSPATAQSMYGSAVTGTSQGGGQTPVIGSPSLATNMDMRGAGVRDGSGMYTGANGPLNMSLFAPNGRDAAMAQGNMGGFGEELFKAAQAGGLNPNMSYLGFMDDLSRRTLQARGGSGGLMPQDFVNYLQSQGGQQWVNSQRAQPQNQPQIQQTGPQNPPSAPLPPPQQQSSSSITNMMATSPLTPEQREAWQRTLAGHHTLNSSQQEQQYSQFITRLTQQGYSPQQANELLQRSLGGQQVAQPGAGSPYWNNIGMQTPGGGGYNPNYGGPQVDQAYSNFGNDPRMLQQINAQRQYDMFLQQGGDPYSTGNQMQPYSTQMPYGNQQQYPQPGGYPGGNQQMPFGNQRGELPQGPNWSDLSEYGRQQYGMPTMSQIQQPYQQNPYQQQQPQLPQATSGSNRWDNDPNPWNQSTGQTAAPTIGTPTTMRSGGNMWGGTTNRAGAFGGGSLFGGFGAQPASNYPRPGGTGYGRPASYGTSQRPY